MAKRWLIDGNNLLHQVRSLKASAPSHAIAPLAQLAELIDDFCRRQNGRAHLLFDGPARKLPGSYARISVSFSKHQSADEQIIRRIRKAGAAKRWVVVTDDREILDAARKSGVKTETASGFRQRLIPPSGQKTGPKYSGKPEKRHDFKVSDQEVDHMLLLYKLRDEHDD